MSIMQKLFGTAAQAPNAALAAQPVVAPTAGNGVVPDNVTTAVGATAGSELDGFKEFWQADPNNKAPEPLFNIDPTKLAEAAKGNDFSKAIPAELMTKIAAGGEEAQQAMLQAMNSMAQKSFGDSTLTTAKIVEAALAKQQENFLKELPAIMKSHALGDELRSKNSAFSNPAIAPVFDMLKNQVAIKHPNATLEEQRDLATRYFNEFAKAVSPQQQPANSNKQNKASKEEDWSTFL